MKALTLSIVLILSSSFGYTKETSSEKSYKFHYSMPKKKTFSITQTAFSQEQAFKLAAKECFKKLTAGKYPGEERGLEIIDICANPRI